MTNLTMQDINQYITTIRINFENAYKTQNEDERIILIKSWFAILKEYPKEIVDKAVINAIKNSEYAPRINTIVKEIEKIREAYEPTETELWAELLGVLREVEKNVYRFRFNFRETNGLTQGENAELRVQAIFNNLSPLIKEYLKSWQGLCRLSAFSESELTFEKGRFLKIIPTLKERGRTKQETIGIANLVQGLISLPEATCDNTKLLTEK